MSLDINSEIYLTPAAATLYGSSNYGTNKICFNKFSLSEEILRYLQEEIIFNVPENQSTLESLGFTRCVDYPDVPGHVYYEGYFHSLLDPSPFPSLHPRIGIIHDKPSAPIRVVAFCESVRRKNKAWVNRLRDRLAASPSHATEALVRIIDDNRLFAGDILQHQPFLSFLSFYHVFKLSDLAVQVHYGDEIIRGDMRRYHVDAPNSLLHMGVSVRGNRHGTLPQDCHALLICDTTSGLFCGRRVPLNPKIVRISPLVGSHSDQVACISLIQRLSSTASSTHSLIMRTVSLQCSAGLSLYYLNMIYSDDKIFVGRCLLTMDDLNDFGSEVRHGFKESIAAVYEALSGASEQKESVGLDAPLAFCMPTIDDIREVEAEILKARRLKNRSCTIT